MSDSKQQPDFGARFYDVLARFYAGTAKAEELAALYLYKGALKQLAREGRLGPKDFVHLVDLLCSPAFKKVPAEQSPIVVNSAVLKITARILQNGNEDAKKVMLATWERSARALVELGLQGEAQDKLIEDHSVRTKWGRELNTKLISEKETFSITELKLLAAIMNTEYGPREALRVITKAYPVVGGVSEQLDAAMVKIWNEYYPQLIEKDVRAAADYIRAAVDIIPYSMEEKPYLSLGKVIVASWPTCMDKWVAQDVKEAIIYTDDLWLDVRRCRKESDASGFELRTEVQEWYAQKPHLRDMHNVVSFPKRNMKSPAVNHKL